MCTHYCRNDSSGPGLRWPMHLPQSHYQLHRRANNTIAKSPTCAPWQATHRRQQTYVLHRFTVSLSCSTVPSVHKELMTQKSQKHCQTSHAIAHDLRAARSMCSCAWAHWQRCGPRLCASQPHRKQTYTMLPLLQDRNLQRKMSLRNMPSPCRTHGHSKPQIPHPMFPESWLVQSALGYVTDDGGQLGFWPTCQSTGRCVTHAKRQQQQ